MPLNSFPSQSFCPALPSPPQRLTHIVRQPLSQVEQERSTDLILSHFPSSNVASFAPLPGFTMIDDQNATARAAQNATCLH